MMTIPFLTPYSLSIIGLLLDIIGALLLAPGILGKAKRVNDVYKLLRTEGIQPTAFTINSYLHEKRIEPRRLGTPEEEFHRYRREWTPTAIGVSLLVTGFLCQLLAVLLRGPT